MLDYRDLCLFYFALHVLHGLPLYRIQKLYLAQSAVDGLLVGGSRFSHMTPTGMLLWLQF